MSMTFHWLGYARYEWHVFGSQTVLSLGHSATLVHNTQVLVVCNLTSILNNNITIASVTVY